MIGAFEIKSGVIEIGDIDYLQFAARNGAWNFCAVVQETKHGGERVWELVAWHSAYAKDKIRYNVKWIDEVSVDGGSVAVQDFGEEVNRKDFESHFDASEHGVRCSSGYGDGGYPVKMEFDTNGLCVAVSVLFIGDGADDPDESWD